MQIFGFSEAFLHFRKSVWSVAGHCRQFRLTIFAFWYQYGFLFLLVWMESMGSLPGETARKRFQCRRCNPWDVETISAPRIGKWISLMPCLNNYSGKLVEHIQSASKRHSYLEMAAPLIRNVSTLKSPLKSGTKLDDFPYGGTLFGSVVFIKIPYQYFGPSWQKSLVNMGGYHYIFPSPVGFY